MEEKAKYLLSSGSYDYPDSTQKHNANTEKIQTDRLYAMPHKEGTVSPNPNLTSVGIMPTPLDLKPKETGPKLDNIQPNPGWNYDWQKK